VETTLRASDCSQPATDNPPQLGYEVYGKALLGVEEKITPLV